MATEVLKPDSELFKDPYYDHIQPNREITYQQSGQSSPLDERVARLRQNAIISGPRGGGPKNQFHKVSQETLGLVKAAHKKLGIDYENPKAAQTTIPLPRPGREPTKKTPTEKPDPRDASPKRSTDKSDAQKKLDWQNEVMSDPSKVDFMQTMIQDSYNELATVTVQNQTNNQQVSEDEKASKTPPPTPEKKAASPKKPEEAVKDSMDVDKVSLDDLDDESDEDDPMDQDPPESEPSKDNASEESDEASEAKEEQEPAKEDKEPAKSKEKKNVHFVLDDLDSDSDSEGPGSFLEEAKEEEADEENDDEKIVDSSDDDDDDENEGQEAPSKNKKRKLPESSESEDNEINSDLVEGSSEDSDESNGEYVRPRRETTKRKLFDPDEYSSDDDEDDEDDDRKPKKPKKVTIAARRPVIAGAFAKPASGIKDLPTDEKALPASEIMSTTKLTNKGFFKTTFFNQFHELVFNTLYAAVVVEFKNTEKDIGTTRVPFPKNTLWKFIQDKLLVHLFTNQNLEDHEEDSLDHAYLVLMQRMIIYECISFDRIEGGFTKITLWKPFDWAKEKGFSDSFEYLVKDEHVYAYHNARIAVNFPEYLYIAVRKQAQNCLEQERFQALSLAQFYKHFEEKQGGGLTKRYAVDWLNACKLSSIDVFLDWNELSKELK